MRLRLVRTTAFAAAVAATVAAPLALAGGPTATAADQARAMLARYAGGLPASYQAPPVGVDPQCFAPAGHPDPQVDSSGHPTNPVWIRRDEVNQYCALLRIRDQLASPAFGYGNLTVGGQLYAQQAEEQAADGPNHVHGGITTLIPGSQGADPFRSVDRWQRLTGGRETEVRFRSLDGAQLRGHIWLPPKSVPKPRGGYPGVVITDGSIQAYENLYYWAAEGLAQYGYEVMTYDVQGQGDSDLFPANCSPSSCTGVPYQQNYNFYQGAEDSLNYFLSRANPGRPALDARRVGIAGHSLGASAVSWVSQCDTRVKAVVAWDDLIPVDVKKCAANVTVPKAYRSRRLHAPALTTTNDYEFNVQPADHVPDPHGDSNAGGLDGDTGYRSLAKAGVDTELVSFRNGTHLTYTYIDLVLPSNELSERFAFNYTLAWFDRYLRAGRDPYTAMSAYDRLTSLGRYDTSADRNSKGVVSIGAGVFDPTVAAGNPSDPMAGNAPYRIAGIPILDSLSFYYYSQYHLTDPRTGRLRTCVDMLAKCPRKAPKVP
jgi:dienelactone hydrolase